MITHVIKLPYKSKNLSNAFYNSQTQKWEDILKIFVFYYFKKLSFFLPFILDA